MARVVMAIGNNPVPRRIISAVDSAFGRTLRSQRRLAQPRLFRQGGRRAYEGTEHHRLVSDSGALGDGKATV